MKVIFLSAAVALVLGFGAAFLLDRSHEPAYEAFVGSGARVSEPGTNLVGPTWSGQPNPPKS